jgi:predicted amino acid dehydrogenase
MRGPVLILGAFALALVAAGCGESAAKKREKFLTRATSICKHFENLQNQVQVPSVNPVAAKTSHTARAQWGLGIKQLAYLGTQEVKALGELKPPKDIEDAFGRFLDTKGGAFALMLKGADAAKRNHVSEIKAPIQASRAGLTEASKQARALGLPECA